MRPRPPPSWPKPVLTTAPWTSPAGNDGTARLAPALAELMIDLLRHVARGERVAVVPTDSLLTTQQAANILNVSRPFFSNLPKTKEIPYIPVGSHRRVTYSDLIAYKRAPRITVCLAGSGGVGMIRRRLIGHSSLMVTIDHSPQAGICSRHWTGAQSMLPRPSWVPWWR